MRQYDPQIPVFDSHCHVCFPQPIDETLRDYGALLSNLSVSGAVLLSCPNTSHCENTPDVLENMKVLYLKDRLSVPCYAAAGFTQHWNSPEPYADFAREMLAMGFDGFKALEQHPRNRKELGKGLNNPSFAQFFEILDELHLPMVSHVGDPRPSWDLSTASAEAIRLGRVYADGFLSLNALYDEMEEVLDRYPNIRFIFAHFYFHSDNYQRACMLMEKYPNLCFDLTPGGEMFVNFGKHRSFWHEFFLKYADRLLLGSDQYAAGHGTIRYELVRNFLEGCDPFDYYGNTILPMPIPKEVLNKIYTGNVKRIYGDVPKPVNRALAYEHCRRIRETQSHLLTEAGRANLEIMMNHWKPR